MTADTEQTAPTASAGTASLVPAPPSTPATPQARRGAVWGSAVAGVVALAALVSSALLWQRLSHVQEQLAQQAAQCAAQADAARTQAAAAQDLARNSAQRLDDMQARLAELQLQRAQMDELLRNAARPRDESLAMDLESVLRLAQQHAEISGNVQPLLAALRNAKVRIERAAQPGLAPALQTLERDLQRLSALQLPDTAGLLTRLEALERLVEKLPLRSDIAPASKTPPAVAARQAPAAQGPVTSNTPTADPPARWTQWQWWRTGWNTVWNNWGQRTWAAARQQVQDLVRVRRIDQPQALLLAPEQGYFLRENLRRSLQSARLALLARQWQSARADLDAAAARPIAAIARKPAAATRSTRNRRQPGRAGGGCQSVRVCLLFSV